MTLVDRPSVSDTPGHTTPSEDSWFPQADPPPKAPAFRHALRANHVDLWTALGCGSVVVDRDLHLAHCLLCLHYSRRD